MTRKIALAVLLLSMPLFSPGQDTLSRFRMNNLWGFKNSDGVVVIEAKYQQANPTRDGFASVKQNNKWGFVDMKGKVITPFKYDPLYDGNRDYADYRFSEGMAAVSVGRKWGYINTAGKEVILPVYSYAESFHDGTAVVKGKDRTLIIDKTGRSLLKQPYKSIFDFYFDRAVVELNGKSGVIDRKGREIVPLKYDYTSSYFSEGFLVVKKGDKETLLDTQGKEVIPFTYESMQGVADSMAMVRMEAGGPWGYINYKGELVIPLQYESGFRFEKGRALVRKDGKWGLIDKTNNAVTQFKYEDEGVDRLVMFDRFPQGLVALMYKGKYGYVDVATGKETTPFKYERAWGFNGCCAQVMMKGKWYELDKNGKETLLKEQP